VLLTYLIFYVSIAAMIERNNQTQDSWWPRYADRMDGMQASEIRELLKIIEQPGVTSFAGGIPDPELFPREAVRQAYEAILSDPVSAGKALQYSVSEGDPDLRAWIVDHMAMQGVACTIDNILITSGSQQGLEFLGKTFISPGDTALVSAPTYLGALQAFACNQPNYDALATKATNQTATSYRDTAVSIGSKVSFSYVVPDFANPTGETLTLEERHRLIDLVHDLDVPLVEDNPYGQIRFEGEPLPALLALECERVGSINNSRVIYCGSFSKVFTPGLRVGWVCASEEIIRRLCLIKQASDLNSPAINQRVMFWLAQREFDNQIAKTKASYGEKRDAMLAALQNHMPDGITWTRPQGGMFIWLTLPKGTDAAQLLDRSVREAGVAFVPGQAFYADKSGKNKLRLSYSLPTAAMIEVGIVKLATLLKAV
jgi:DNA-binding transcriptional MocR family regulator